jgi:putative transposase
LLDEIVRDGARAMLAAALAEVAAYIYAHVDEVDENGYRLVVRNGDHCEREVLTSAGAVPVRAPRVNDKRIDAETGQRRRFSSAILPAWARKSPQVAQVLPLLYLHGLSSSDFGPALEQFLGSAAGLSAATITRLTAQWHDDAEAFTKRSLKDTDYVYVYVGRRDPSQGSLGAGQGVPAGDDRGARRRHQGTGRARRRVARVVAVVG